MLNVLRQNATSWFMIAIFAIITIVFIFTFGSWGGGDVSGKLPVAASVNGRIISQAQFTYSYQNEMRGKRLSPQKAQEFGLKKIVLDRLVDTELLAQQATSRGLVVPDQVLAKQIMDIFKDRETYTANVNGQFGMTEARFEEQLRRQLLAQRMQEVITEAQRVSPVEIKEAFELANSKVNLETLRIDPMHFKVEDQLTDPKVAEYQAAHEDEIAAHYKEHINRYRKSKEVRARHILAKFDAKASDAEKAKAKAKVEAALKRVNEGEDFAEVAKDVSEDSSASKGGDLGFFGTGKMVKPFEDAAFALEAGKMSDIVESKFGYHVIKVEEVKPEEIRELDAVRPEIAKKMLGESSQKAKAMEWAKDAIAALAAGKSMDKLKLKGFKGDLASPDSAEPTAPRVEETGMFDKAARYIPRVGISDEVVAKAFTLTKESPVMAEPQEIGGRIYVLRMKEREEPDAATFGTQKEMLEQGLVASRAQPIVKAFLEQLRETADIDEAEGITSYGPR